MGWINVSNSWKPSARRPRIFSSRLILQGDCFSNCMDRSNQRPGNLTKAALGSHWFRAQIDLASFPGFDADMVEEPESIAEGIAVERIVGWPKGNGIDARVFGHFDRPLDRAAAVIPVEQEIFPFHQRPRKTSRVAVINQRLHIAVSFLKTPVVLVFLEHRIADTCDGKQQMARAERGFTLGVSIQNDSVRGNHYPAIRVFFAQ